MKWDEKMFQFQEILHLKLLVFSEHVTLYFNTFTKWCNNKQDETFVRANNLFFWKYLLYFYNWLVIKSQSMYVYTKNPPCHLLLLLGEMSRLNVLLKGTTAAIWSSEVYYSSTLLQLPRQLWQSDQKLAFTTATLLPPQVWYELDWNLIFEMRSAHMRCFSQANQQAR